MALGLVAVAHVVDVVHEARAPHRLADGAAREGGISRCDADTEPLAQGSELSTEVVEDADGRTLGGVHRHDAVSEGTPRLSQTATVLKPWPPFVPLL